MGKGGARNSQQIQKRFGAKPMPTSPREQRVTKPAAPTMQTGTDTNRLSESNTISMGLCLRPLGCENVDDNVGSGGCTAHTLKELNVFATVAAAMTSS